MKASSSGGRGPGGSGAARLWGRRLPIALLLLSVWIAAFGAFEAFRSQRSHAATTASLLEDYGAFAAFTYQQRSGRLLYDALQRRFSVARNNAQFAQGFATQQCLALLLRPEDESEACNCPADIAGEYAFHARLEEGGSSARWAGVVPETEDRVRIIQQVQDHARSHYGRGWLYALAYLDLEDQAPAVVAYTLLESPRMDLEALAPRDTLIYGFHVNPDGLGRLYERALDDEVILPPSLTRTRPNSEVIAVEVLGPGREVVYKSSGGPLAFASETRQSAILGEGPIRASVLPAVADQLIIGGLPRDRTPLFVLIFGVAGALAVLALIQLRREDRLALLRQDFVASVSHELRTPLAQVRLFTETLRLGRTETREQADWALENIDRETHRLANLVDNILHFSRSERGLLSVDTEPGDLAAVARDAISAFRRLIPVEKAELSVVLPSDLPTELDVDATRQVLLNLLDNAVRYGPPGQVLRVSGRRQGDWVELAVEDEGPGVPLEDRERIFEPFLRGDHTLGTVVVGSGIGLSVVKGIVEAQGGRVWVEDRWGAPGARFVFRLPVRRSQGRELRDRPGGVALAGSRVS